MMHMTFYWGPQVTLLFTSWRTESLLGYLLTLIACVAASAFYQYLEHVRIRIRIRRRGRIHRVKTQLDEPLLVDKSLAGGNWSAVKIAGGLAFALSSALGYFLMLAVMSFNGGVFLAIVFGLTAGNLAFRIQDEDDDADNIGVNTSCACA